MSNLSDHDIDLIADKLATKLKRDCACNLSAAAQAKMGHLLGMIEDIGGEGGTASGIETFRAIGKRYSRSQRIAEVVAGKLIYIVLYSAVFAVAWGIYQGCMAIIKTVAGGAR
jgi:hypothetical protein